MSKPDKLTPVQQAAAIDRAGETIALRSGAGCGKTFVLARRFTELLLSRPDAENPLAKFVAVTFTDKAALDMSQRIGRLLADLARRSNKADRRRLIAWGRQLPEARISTIHGFCASLLRTYAVEAAVDPNFTVCADQLLVDQMTIEAAERAVLAAVAGGRADAAELLGQVSFDRAVELVRTLLEKRNDCDAGDYADPQQTLARWRSELQAQRQAELKRLKADESLGRQIEAAGNAACLDPSDKLLARRDRMIDAARGILQGLRTKTSDEPAATQEKFGRFGSARAWGGKDGLKDIKKLMGRIAAAFEYYAELAEPIGDADARSAELLATLTSLAIEADRIYTAAKRARGLLDFDDLPGLAHKLLADHDDVRRAVRSQIDQLLVDECQDTNGFQVSLLDLLVCDDRRANAPADGKLFVVGDAKQSIYRFRGAQVEVFDDLCRRLGPDRQESLDVSFRTHAAGTEFVNHLFAPLMGEAYSPIRAHRTQTPPAPSVEILLAKTDDGPAIDSADSSIAAQAEATARRIAGMLRDRQKLVWDPHRQDWRPVEAGDIAILFSRMTVSLEFERRLARHGVPYYVVAGSGFFQQQGILDVLNALGAIDCPFDDVALIGALRSGLFGLDDNAMMRLAEAFDPPYFKKFEKLAAVDGLSKSDRRTLEFATGLIASLHHLKDAVGIDRLIERLLEATGYEAVLLSQPQGRRMVGNVRRLIDQARLAAAERISLSDFLARMHDRVMHEARFEQAAVAGEAENVVRLMTIHKAKGMEFPVVFIPDLNRGMQDPNDLLLNRRDWGLTCKLPAEADESSTNLPLSYRLALSREILDMKKENIRLLYVAATRHKDHLVFVGADWRNADGEFRKGSHLRAMDEVLKIADAIDDEREAIGYADGRYAAAVRTIRADGRAGPRRSQSIGQKLLAAADSPDRLAEEILAQAKPSGPAGQTAIGPLGATIGHAELAVTALSEFEHCPMLYRWRYELRAPTAHAGAGNTSSRRPAGALDGAAEGTLFHRCMELADFSRLGEAVALVPDVLAEMGLDEVADTSALQAEFGEMLERFATAPLCRQIAAARTIHRELDFAMAMPSATLRGQIDLLFEDAAGKWHLVDYKSDRVTGGQIGPKAGHYELQMLLYAAAVARHLGCPPADATLYFLRPAAEDVLTIQPETLTAVQARAERLCGELVSARRSGSFRRAQSEFCKVCPYGPLCAHLPA